MPITIRKFTPEDVPDLQKAIDADKFHPGEWNVDHFKEPATVNVIGDSKGPIAFVRYTKTLRISCVWSDGEDVSRNARAIIQGLNDAVQKARASGYTEIIITTSHKKLAVFFGQVMKMTRSGDEYILLV
jgi:hypothetical protein